MLRALRQAAILCALAVPPAAVMGYFTLAYRTDEPLRPGEVRFAEAWAWGEAAIWVDSRPVAKFSRRHIPSAISLSAEEWDGQVSKFLDAWDPEKKVIVYGDRTGDTAATVALRLKEELKIEGVWILHGGFETWLQR